MKKFRHMFYIILKRIAFTLILILLSPLWILFGLFLALSAPFGSFDDIYDAEYYEDGEMQKECPDYVEKVD